MRGLYGYNADVDALEDVCQLDVEDLSRVALEVVVATAALTAFQVQAQFNREGAFVTLFSAAADYLSPSGILVGASGDLTAQAVGTGWLILDVAGIYRLKLRAAGTSSVVTIIGGGQ